MMFCKLAPSSDRKQLVCTICGRVAPSGQRDPSKLHLRCGLLQERPTEPPRVAHDRMTQDILVTLANQHMRGRPGYEATKITRALKLPTRKDCGCEEFAAQMDAWGVKGCKEHLAEIVEHFQKAATKYGWVDKIKAAGAAALTGLALEIDIIDPTGWIAREAIRRAEEKEAQAQSELR